jgi:metal-responsive CopG/Arc/MetJ family transcriptional regulator
MITTTEQKMKVEIIPDRVKDQATSMILYKDQNEEISRISKKTGASRAKIIRQAVDVFIEAWKNTNTRSKKGN